MKNLKFFAIDGFLRSKFTIQKSENWGKEGRIADRRQILKLYLQVQEL